MQDVDVKSSRRIGTLREGEGEGNNAKLNNSSTVQHFHTGFQTKIAITFLFALTKCAYLLLALLARKKTASYIVRAEPIKEAQASSQHSVYYTTFNRQHLCEERCIKNEVRHSNTRGI